MFADSYFDTLKNQEKTNSSKKFKCKVKVFWLKFKIKSFMIYFEEERILRSQRKIIKTLQASVQWVLQKAPNTAELLCVWMKGLCSMLWI